MNLAKYGEIFLRNQSRPIVPPIPISVERTSLTGTPPYTSSSPRSSAIDDKNVFDFRTIPIFFAHWNFWRFDIFTRRDQVFLNHLVVHCFQKMAKVLETFRNETTTLSKSFIFRSSSLNVTVCKRTSMSKLNVIRKV